jgi:hypothetical protein
LSIEPAGSKKIMSPIIGFGRVKRIGEGTDVRGKELTAEDEKYVEKLYQERAVEGH